MKRSCYIVAVLAILAGSFCFINPANAQWLTQTVTVTNGWTAAYLFVDASSQPILPTTQNLPISPGNPIDQIWLWQVPASTSQYITTPQSPLNSGGHWISWNMTNSQNSLSALIPNSAYLIHSSGVQNYSWAIQGKPVPPNYVWDLTGLNLIGFSTPASRPPTFGSYFAQVPAIADAIQIFQYPGGPFSTQPPNMNPTPVIFLNSTPVNRGQAYWVGTSNVNNTYFGPFHVNLPNPAGLSFGSNVGQFTFHLVNITANALTVSMSVLQSETPPFGQSPIVAPPPLLLEGAQNSSNLTYAYTAINGSSTSWTLPPFGQPGSDLPVVLGINRFSMPGTNGALYAGILQFTDSLGFSQLNVPVSANVAGNTGLWVGKANITQVSYDLKSYATNNDGSYVSTLVTNPVVTFATNSAATVGLVTNALIINGVTSNVLTTYYSVTNEVINTYTTTGTSITSNGLVLSTNVILDLDSTTNTYIETTVTGYYFTNNGELLMWETTNTTNVTISAATPITNQVIVTNQIAPVPTNGTIVLVTNFQYYNYAFESLLITNAIFSSPVTNVLSSANYTATNFLVASNAAYNGFVTNLNVAISTTTNGPTANSYSTTTNSVSLSATTNLFPAPPLYVFTNAPNLIAVSVATNIYSVTNSVAVAYVTNFTLVNNNYAVTNTTTNLVGSSSNVLFASVANAPTNVTFTTFTNLSLVFTTTPLVVAITNMLVSSISNYVISAYNTNLDAVVASYPLRLIVFNDQNGTCSLLERVYYGLRQNTNLVVATTESVLDTSHLNVARRITATHLPWSSANTPWVFSGGPLVQGGTYTTTVTTQYDDQASNPFLHTYHPDHNDLDTESPPHELPIGSESYEIDRTITLSLAANTNDFISLTTANSGLAGLYNETISLRGLAGFAKTYQTAGTFSLQCISTIPSLTTH